jgi:hypothetical protein
MYGMEEGDEKVERSIDVNSAIHNIGIMFN